VSSREDIKQRLDQVRERIANAARRAGRDPADVTLLAVSKKKPARAVADAFEHGQLVFGESYVQEACEKIIEVQALLSARSQAAPGDLALPRWHFVGKLQRNKARAIAWNMDCFHALDREALALELEKHAARAGRTLDVLIQVNLSGESQKGGVSPEEVRPLLEALAPLSHLRPIGLMALPPATKDPESNRPYFTQLRQLRDQLRNVEGFDKIRELSMGMSQDFEIAVEEGATYVRLGTALFGARS
jgi:pyridoxal phosphate enzyme (YggS family)